MVLLEFRVLKHALRNLSLRHVYKDRGVLQFVRAFFA
jgi:hypothetical protein